MHFTTEFKPNWVSIPGCTINDVLVERNYSIQFFAKELKKTPDFVNRLISGHEEITKNLARDLTGCLGGSEEFWLSRERLFRAQIEEVNRNQGEPWLKQLPVGDMVKLGWIENVTDKLTECLRFFDVTDVSSWRKKYSKTYQNVSFRTSLTFETDWIATLAWLRKGEIAAELRNCQQWNEDMFIAAIDEIRPLTRKKNPAEFIPLLQNICADCGVALVFARTPKGCRASGVTYFLNEKKALILMSFRYLSDDHFWFTFFHEAGHLILHKSKTPIVELDKGTDPTDNLEQEANSFASEALIPYQLQPELYKLPRNKRNIINFAIKAGISPGIVIGQMQHRGIIDFKYLNSYKRRYDWDQLGVLE